MKPIVLNRAQEPAAPLPPSVIADAASRAARSVAPCWPLKDFLAVNPFLGLASQGIAEVAQRMASVAGARVFMPRAFYAEALATGRILEADLAAALEAEPAGARLVGDVHRLRAMALDGSTTDEPLLLPTVADVACQVTGTDWSAFACDRISRWAAAYYDEGQAYWPSPWRHLEPYAAWRAEALLDRTPEVMGLRGFRAAVEQLPKTSEEAIRFATDALAIPEAGLEHYFHRLLMTQGGWSAYARYRDWQRELAGDAQHDLGGLLAIRLAWEVVLLRSLSGTRVHGVWQTERARLMAVPSRAESLSRYAVELLLQRAYENAWQTHLLGHFDGHAIRRPEARSAVQAVFCIDVRSEVYRRALEASADDIETFGFAGFFGVPMAYARLANTEARPHCPALIAPKFVIQEKVAGAGEEEQRAVARQRLVWGHASRIWKSFKQGAVASLGYVETMGLAYVCKLVTDSLGLTRPVADPRGAGLADGVAARLTPCLEEDAWMGGAAGLSNEARVRLATSALQGMSLTTHFARLVLLAGHSATTTNNAHAAGLDCGACGGHSGEASARVLAMILNDGAVRRSLTSQGIQVPEDTVFLAGNHDTTTDTMALFDTGLVPESHHGDLDRLRAHLDEAGRRARRERASLLGMDSKTNLLAAFAKRARDWSEIRPEWGLAGCAAFVAAPRQRTRDLSLKGRAFLHDYDWHRDEGFAVLESVMTAPLVVASWISMQYYASAVDNRVFGSGEKTLHNVVGTVGVLEGYGGDLRVGLPWQSVHNGDRLVHEPVRLTAIIEAPVQAINDVIKKHAALRALLDNGWLQLFALDARGVARARYIGGGAWAEVATGEHARVGAA